MISESYGEKLVANPTRDLPQIARFRRPGRKATWKGLAFFSVSSLFGLRLKEDNIR